MPIAGAYTLTAYRISEREEGEKDTNFARKFVFGTFGGRGQARSIQHNAAPKHASTLERHCPPNGQRLKSTGAVRAQISRCCRRCTGCPGRVRRTCPPPEAGRHPAPSPAGGSSSCCSRSLSPCRRTALADRENGAGERRGGGGQDLALWWCDARESKQKKQSLLAMPVVRW